MIYQAIQKCFEKKLEKNIILFRSSVTGRELWNLYMKGFGKDPVYRDPESSVHNCNCCRNFIERYGNVVAIDLKTYQVQTYWDCIDLLTADEKAEYSKSLKSMVEALLKAPIANTFSETYDFLNSVPYEKCKRTNQRFRLGIEKNLKMYTDAEAAKFGVVKAGRVYEYPHFSLSVPKSCIDMTGASEASLMAKHRDAKESLGKLMEIPVETYELVNELINQDSILNGKPYQDRLKRVIKIHKEYNKIKPEDRDNWLWVTSRDLDCVSLWGNVLGTLIKDLASGTDLNSACRSWNQKVDPVNYMKAKAPITQRQIDEAKKFLTDNGYVDSFTRRMATLVDIKSEDIKYLGTSGKSVKVLNVLDNLTPTAQSNAKPLDKDKLQEVSIEDFMNSILPGSKDVQIYFENSQVKNLMTLTTAADKENKKIFKWSNNYSWTYNGGLAGKSMITQAVKAAGGQTQAVVRCSLVWNEKGDAPHTDLDIHCMENTLNDHVYYGSYQVGRGLTDYTGFRKSKGGGLLDLDIQDPVRQCNGGIAAENIFYPVSIADGKYCFFARNFNGGSNNGAKAEIQVGDQIYNYEIKGHLNNTTDYVLATITFKGGQVVNIEQSSYFTGGVGFKQKVWDINTQEFHKVSMVCLSPNYWKEPGVGNKHYFFFIDGAKCPDKIRSFHNENLSSELLTHRKVMEVLGNTVYAESIDGQLSGLGFNATVREEAVLKVDGKLLKIKF